MRVEIAGPNLLDQSRGEFEIHVAGCGSADRNTMERTLTFDVGSVWEAAGIMYDHVDDDELAFYRDEVHVMRCAVAAGLPEGDGWV